MGSMLKYMVCTWILSNQLSVNNYYQVANVEIDENNGWLNVIEVTEDYSFGMSLYDAVATDAQYMYVTNYEGYYSSIRSFYACS